jgi:hypothetical protein
MPRSKKEVPLTDDHIKDLWRRSESPHEEWEEDGDWAVSIIGEEVDYWGDIRYALCFFILQSVMTEAFCAGMRSVHTRLVK